MCSTSNANRARHSARNAIGGAIGVGRRPGVGRCLLHRGGSAFRTRRSEGMPRSRLLALGACAWRTPGCAFATLIGRSPSIRTSWVCGSPSVLVARSHSLPAPRLITRWRSRRALVVPPAPRQAPARLTIWLLKCGHCASSFAFIGLCAPQGSKSVPPTTASVGRFTSTTQTAPGWKCISIAVGNATVGHFGAARYAPSRNAGWPPRPTALVGLADIAAQSAPSG